MKRALILTTLAAVAALGLSAFSDDAKPACCAARSAKAAKKDAKECEKAEAKAGTKAAMCDAAQKTEVALTGKLLCEHCNLKKTEKCSPVFQAEGREGYLPICPETKDLTAFKAAGAEGENVLQVKGYLCKTKDGKEMLTVTSFVKKGDAKA